MTVADGFASQYRALRIREGWAQADGLEDPETGDPKLWSGRVRSVAAAAEILSGLQARARRPLIIDVGAGGAWAHRLLPEAVVVAVDLLAPPPGRAASFVRADMRHLPLLDRSADGVLFAASLHYVPVAEVIAEVARVLRPGGLMVAVDSPIYPNSASRAAATKRSEAYYARSGYPALAASYHPIDARELKSALHDSGLTVERWRAKPSFLDRVRGKRPHASMVVARLT